MINTISVIFWDIEENANSSNMHQILFWNSYFISKNIKSFLITRTLNKYTQKFTDVFCCSNLAIGRFLKSMVFHNHLLEDEIVYVSDNKTHKAEVFFYCPKINSLGIEEFKEFLSSKSYQEKDVIYLGRPAFLRFNEKDDYGFLRYLELRIEILENCGDAILQIHNLMMEENICNFSKSKLSIEELIELFYNEKIICKYIILYNKFQSYGVVGFLAIKNQEYRHLVLSSKVAGYGMEKFLKNNLNLQCKIKLEQLDENSVFKETINTEKKYSLLVRGGCDVEQIIPYLKNDEINIIREFNLIPFRRDHSVYLCGCEYYSQTEKNSVIQQVPFVTPETYSTRMYDEDIDYVVWSSLMEMTQGIYVNQTNGLKVAYKNYDTPYEFCNDRFAVFDSKKISKFVNNWKYCPHISPEDYQNNLEKIYSRLSPKANLIIVTGAEVPIIEGKELGRHETHARINSISEEFARIHQRVHLLDVRKYVNSKDELTNNLRHYKSYIYCKLAEELAEIIKREEYR